jgi:nucleoside-diphosphate-sugar epimerase
MRILVTGAAGFIGRRLAAALLARDFVTDASGRAVPIDELILADRAAPTVPADPRARCVAADVSDPSSLAALLRDKVDSVFSLAATLTVEAESDYARGLAVNLHGVLSLLEACRSSKHRPRFVFPSSIAAFGGPLPEVVDDRVQHTPQTSYGTHKAIGELLVNDYSRLGFVDGRTLRLPVVLVRASGQPAPGAPTPPPTVSGAIAALVSERLAGKEVVCPLDPETRIAAASVERVVDALVAVHDLPAEGFGHTRALNLPSLSLTLRELAEAAERAAARVGIQIGTLRWAPDPRFQSAVDQWPRRFVSEAASSFGIRSDASADEIVSSYLREHPELGSQKP